MTPTRNHPDPYEPLSKSFTSHSWVEVLSTKEELESLQATAIPVLLQISERDEEVDLEGTADLIYPGAEKFYGHGWVLDYDVDWLSIRAGWALEDLTFQNFGFREREMVKWHSTPRSRLRAAAVSHAKAWWQTNQAGWTRFNAVLEALRSEDPVRQEAALGWIRFGKTKCDG